jgi:hypothetical protein
MSTLLEKALAVQVRQRAKSIRTKEDMELALAWMTGRVTSGQVATALGHDPANRGSLYSFLSIAFKRAYEEGMIKLAGKENK